VSVSYDILHSMYCKKAAHWEQIACVHKVFVRGFVVGEIFTKSPWHFYLLWRFFLETETCFVAKPAWHGGQHVLIRHRQCINTRRSSPPFLWLSRSVLCRVSQLLQISFSSVYAVINFVLSICVTEYRSDFYI